jgi:DNA polymerase-3 subunit delta'
MFLDSFAGNKLAIQVLDRALESKRVASAYLFHGPDGVGKSLVALHFAKTLVCRKQETQPCGDCSSCRRVDSGNHPDVHWYKPSGKMRVVRIDEVRELIAQTGLKAFESDYKVFIITEADRMMPQAQNAILKTLEEPSGRSVLILISSNPAALLPTIVSRCQEVSFLPIPRDEFQNAIEEKWGLGKEEAHLVACLASGSMGSAKRLIDRDNLGRRQVLLSLLAGLSRGGFQEVHATVRAVDEELKQMAKQLREKQEKQIKAMGKALSPDDRQARMNERNAEIESLVREEVEDILNLLAFWYRDLLLVRQGVSPDLVTNLDMIDSLTTSAAATTTGELLSRLAMVDRIRRAIALNLPLPLCLEVFFLSGRRKTPAKPAAPMTQ